MKKPLSHSLGTKSDRGYPVSMTTDPRDIAEELWQLLNRGGRDLLSEGDTSLIGDLLASLGLSESPGSESVTIPARSPRAAIVVEPHEGKYAVRATNMVELPVEISTRRGVRAVDPDDPLAQVQRSIESLEALEF